MHRRKRNAYAIVLCVALSLCLEECKDSLTGYSLYDLQTVIPLHAGSGWTYLDITPSDVAMFPADSQVVDCQVEGFFDSAKTRFYTLNGFIGEGDSSWYYETVTQTRYQRYREDENGNRVVIATILQTPIARGNRWFVNGVDNTLGYAEIANPDTTIDLPSGKFTNVIIVRELAANGNRWFIKPMTGIVYETHFVDVTIARQLVDKNF